MKKIIKKIEQEVEAFIADDGTEFTEEWKCISYESNKFVNKYKQFMLDENGEASFTVVGNGSSASELKNNYDSLKGLINKSCNVAFVPAGTSSDNFGNENVKLSNVYLYPELNIQANQITKIAITAKRETSPGTAVTINAANNT